MPDPMFFGLAQGGSSSDFLLLWLLIDILFSLGPHVVPLLSYCLKLGCPNTYGK